MLKFFNSITSIPLSFTKVLFPPYTWDYKASRLTTRLIFASTSIPIMAKLFQPKDFWVDFGVPHSRNSCRMKCSAAHTPYTFSPILFSRVYTQKLWKLGQSALSWIYRTTFFYYRFFPPSSETESIPREHLFNSPISQLHLGIISNASLKLKINKSTLHAQLQSRATRRHYVTFVLFGGNSQTIKYL